jgi:hypothetical protein
VPSAIGRSGAPRAIVVFGRRQSKRGGNCSPPRVGKNTSLEEISLVQVILVACHCGARQRSDPVRRRLRSRPRPCPGPRTADGHPLLEGLWVNGLGAPSGADSVTFAGRNNNWASFEEDNALRRLLDPNKPQYLPQWWETVKDNDYNGNWLDPRHKCMPEGLPRIGAPSEILHFPERNLVLFRYNTGFDGRSEHRLIYTDGRQHNPLLVAAEGWYGSSVGHWEGDTLVIETIGFTDGSWLHKSGYIHGFNMKVTERITRPAFNQLRWQATVEDPEYLYEPWTMNPVVRTLNVRPGAVLGEDLPCWDFEVIISHTRSG